MEAKLIHVDRVMVTKEKVDKCEEDGIYMTKDGEKYKLGLTSGVLKKWI